MIIIIKYYKYTNIYNITNFNNIMNYNYFYSLPSDIIEYIYNINYNYYANIIQKNWLLYIKNKKMIKFVINMFNRYYDNNIDYMDYNFHIENKHFLQKIVELCNNCKCCKKHTINKPKKLEYYNDFAYRISGLYRNSLFINNNCKCSCRHLVRKICNNSSSSYIDYV